MYEVLKPKRNLKMHGYYMRQSLLFGCLVPALMRMPVLSVFTSGGIWQLTSTWVFAIPLWFFNERAVEKQKWY